MTWGNPHRGLAQGGTLAMLGGITRSVRQPAGDGLTDAYGCTLLQRGPGAAVSRTPDELADDAARGYTWRPDALIGGGNMDLYGHTIGGYVYCSPDGSRWLIEAAQLPNVATDQPLNLTLQVRRFGDFRSPAAEPFQLTATLADMGQADADPQQSIGSAAELSVCDIRPDGSAALLMMCVPAAVLEAWREGRQDICRHPMGWLELAIVGGEDGLTATLTVVRTRIQALGSYSLALQNWSGVGSHTLAGQVTTTQGFDGYSIDTTTWVAGTGATFGYDSLTLDDRVAFNGRILALWYSPAGLVEVTISLSYSSGGGNELPTETATGQRVVRRDDGGGPVTVLEDSLYQRIDRGGEITSSLAVQLALNGSVIDQFSGNASNASALRRVVVDSAGGPVGATRTETGSGTLDGQSSSVAQSMPADINTSFFDPLLNGRMSVRFSGSTANPARIAVLSSAWGGEIFMADWMAAQTTPRRYSNNLLALAVSSGPFDFEAGSYNYVHRTGPAANPAGTHDGGLTSGAQGRYYGSYNPATGQVMRDQDEPVCWI